jgi:hypothetical protein
MSGLKRPRDLVDGDVIETTEGVRKTVVGVHPAPVTGWRAPGKPPPEEQPPVLLVRFTDGTAASLQDTDAVLKVW